MRSKLMGQSHYKVSGKNRNNVIFFVFIVVLVTHRGSDNCVQLVEVTTKINGLRKR